jgi:hypothetical protein
MLVAIPLFLYVFPQFLKFNIKDKIVFSLTVIACFIIPFLPFVFGEKSFLNHPEYNPFILQSYQGGVWVFAIGGILLFSGALAWKYMKDLYFLSGLFLFALILTTGIGIAIRNGWSTIIFENELDKSYFNVCIPFFLFFINEIKKRTFDYSNYHIDY